MSQRTNHQKKYYRKSQCEACNTIMFHTCNSICIIFIALLQCHTLNEQDDGKKTGSDEKEDDDGKKTGSDGKEDGDENNGDMN